MLSTLKHKSVGEYSLGCEPLDFKNSYLKTNISFFKVWILSSLSVPKSINSVLKS